MASKNPTTERPDGEGAEKSDPAVIHARNRERFLRTVEQSVRSALKDTVSRSVLERTWMTVTSGAIALFPQPEKPKVAPKRSRFKTATPSLRDSILLAKELHTHRPLREFPASDIMNDSLQVAKTAEERRRLALLLRGTLPVSNMTLDRLYDPQSAAEIGTDGASAFESALKEYSKGSRAFLQALKEEGLAAELAAIEAVMGLEQSDFSMQEPDVPLLKHPEGEKRVHIRWMIRRDMPETLQIEQLSWDEPWNEEDFLRCLRQRNCIGMVCEDGEKVVGFMVYELHKSKLRVLNMAVHPGWRLRGVGAQMIAKLISKLSSHRRTTIDIVLKPTSHETRRFLRKQEFVMDGFEPGAFSETKTLGIVMKYRFCEDGEPEDEDGPLLRKIFGAKVMNRVMRGEEDLLEDAPNDSGEEEEEDGEDGEEGEEDEEEETEEVEEQAETSNATNPVEEEIIPDARAALKKLLERAGRDADIHHDALQAFDAWVRTSDRQMVSIILREGWKHLATVREVTDEEWMHRKSVGKRKDKKGLRTLQDAIKCSMHRETLEKLRKTKNVSAIDAKEKAIFHEVFLALMKFPYAAHGPQESFPPSYRVGTPHYAVSHRVINCFIGPWMMASMLLKCGIPYSRLFFCRSCHTKVNVFDSHGGLLMRTHNNDVLYGDIAFRKIGNPLYVGDGKDKKTHAPMRKLLMGESVEPVNFELTKKRADDRNLPYRMQVAPLAEGFGAVQMLHVGLSFSRKQQWAEAEHAFKLGLALNPLDPNLLYELGTLAFMRGDNETAKEHFRRSLAMDDNLLYNYFTLGEIALAEGDAKEARNCFRKFTKDSRAAFNDNGKMKAKAKQYMDYADGEMLAFWRQSQPSAAVDNGE